MLKMDSERLERAHRVKNKSELRRLNLEIMSRDIGDFVTPVTVLCSDLTGDITSRTRYVAQNAIVSGTLQTPPEG